MKKWIAALIVTLGLFGCGSMEIQNKQTQENFAWSEMCGLLELEADYSCMRLMPPLVVYETMRPGLQGYYDGSDTIYINVDLTGKLLVEVLMHEGIHYVHVQHQFIVVPGPAEAVCWSENEAWTLTGIYYNEDNSNWWRPYRHCWQWYADSDYLRDIGWVYNEVNGIIDGIIIED